MAVKRNTILAAIKTRLETINGAGGYYHDLSSGVYIWHSPAFDEKQLPVANIRDETDEIVYEGMSGSENVHNHRLTAVISLIAAPGSRAVTTIREMLIDIYKAINTDLTWSGSAIHTELIGDEMMVDEEEKVLLGAEATIEITYRTDIWSES